MSLPCRAPWPLLRQPPLLITESADEFDALRIALEADIEPRGIIEQMYVADLASLVWEILRLRRCKAVIVSQAIRSTLEHLLEELLTPPGELSFARRGEAQDLARALVH